MKAVSLFSGIGGFDLGFQLAGIETVLQVENDPWCQAILAHHWPEVQRIGDVHQVDATTLPGRARDVARAGRGSDVERLRPAHGRRVDAAGIDLVYGGFPCQDVSVAGARAGLSGERSGLWFEFRRIVSELRPRWVAIENVPGLLSSGPEVGADFGVILRGLVELGYGVAWRVLDARWFGVPQRRRRIFLVGCLGDAQRAAQVLAVCESCGGHPSAGREAGEDTAPTLDGGARGAGVDLPMIAATLSGGSHPESNLPGRHHEDDENLVIGSRVDDGQALTLVAKDGYRIDAESENLVVASPVRASDGHHGHSSGRGDGGDHLIVADPISTREGKTYTHEGKNNSRTHNVVEAWDDRNQALSTDEYHVLRGAGLQRSDGIATSAGVRRLTPLECERLQGFPDGWTDLVVDGKPVADSHRYKMLGNAVACVVAQWLGHRLVAVDADIKNPAEGLSLNGGKRRGESPHHAVVSDCTS